MPINKIAYSSIEENQENYINILRANQSVSDTGWTTYSDFGGGLNPVDGIGGTASITWSQNTSNPLSGDSDLRLVKSGSTNRQGDGVSIPFTIANRHLAKVLQITFDTELISGTYSSGDLRVSIVQDPDSLTPVVIEPVNTNIQLGIANQRIRHIASFQTHITTTSYRLCIHVSSTSTSNYTVDFANFRVWEPTQSIGSIITDWTDYTPVYGSASGATQPTFSYAKWRRVGGNIQVLIRGTTSATTTSGTNTFTLPSGLFTSIPINTYQIVGRWSRTSADGGSKPVITYTASNLINLGYGYSSGGEMTIQAFSLLSPNENFSLEFELPIQGWGSSVAMSSDSGDGRVVVAIVKNLQTGKTTSNGFYWSTIQNDTHNAIRTTGSGATQRTEFVAPLSGYYRVSCTVNFNNTGAVNIYKNSSVKLIELMYTTMANISQNLSSSVFLNAGDFIYIATSSTYTSNSDSDVGFSIERISAGSQVMAQTETVSVICRTISNGITSTPSSISWTSKEVDSHGAFTASSSRFTAPMSGIYNFHVTWASSNGNAGLIALYDITNSIYLRQTLNPQDSSSRLSVSLSSSVRLLAGQIIEVRFFQISGTSTLSSNLYENFLSIIRVGNY